MNARRRTTSREIVQTSLAFASPPRIPYGMGGGFPTDLRSVGRKPAPNSYAKPWEKRNGYWEMSDEWGNIDAEAKLFSTATGRRSYEDH